MKLTRWILILLFAALAFGGSFTCHSDDGVSATFSD
jgi:hypothetical protein